MAEQPSIDWFFQNLFRPLFGHAEVLSLAGGQLTHHTLQNWTNRKYVKPKIAAGKRIYNALEAATVILAQPLVHRLFLEPSSATLAITSAMLIFNRKLKSDEISLSQAMHQMFVYRAPEDEPRVFDARKPAPGIFENDEAFIVLPIGRLLDDIARRQRILVESRASAKPSAMRAAARK